MFDDKMENGSNRFYYVACGYYKSTRKHLEEYVYKKSKATNEGDIVFLDYQIADLKTQLTMLENIYNCAFWEDKNL